jgi:hypothetical protein
VPDIELEVEFVNVEEEAKFHLDQLRALLKLNAECARMYKEVMDPPRFNWRILRAVHGEVI